MRKRITRALNVESLEGRRLLAGDVTVTRSGADLFVTGDGLSNTVSIESDGAGGVRVIGFADASGQATRINGVANGTFNSAQFSGGVFVNMNAGDDAVRFTNLSARSLSVNLGTGNDSFVGGLQQTGETRFGATPSGRAWTSQYFNVIAGDGNDNIRLQSLYVASSMLIDTGEQNDTITILPGVEGTTVTNSTQRVDVMGSVTIVPGNGSDTVQARGFTTGGGLVLDDAGGPLNAELVKFQSAASAQIFASPGNDNIVVDGAYVQALMQVVAEGGQDNIQIRNLTASNVNINAGLDSDIVSLNTVRAKRADIQLDQGNDQLYLNNVNIDTLFAFGNTGDDLFDVRASRFGNAYFYGESGYDTFRRVNASPNSIDNLYLYTIENNVTI